MNNLLRPYNSNQIHKHHHYNKRRQKKIANIPSASAGCIVTKHQIMDGVKYVQHLLKQNKKVSKYNKQVNKISSNLENTINKRMKIDLKGNTKQSINGVNELDDELSDRLDNLIDNPCITTVSQLQLQMLKEYDIKIELTNKQNEPLKYWEAVWLNKKEHNPRVSLRMCSDNRGLMQGGYTNRNIRRCLKLNNSQLIHLAEIPLPKYTQHSHVLYLIYGTIGGKQQLVQTYVAKHYHIIPLKKLPDKIKTNCSFILPNLTSYKNVINISHKYNNQVMPIRVLKINQRTTFKQFIKHGVPYKKAKNWIKRNYKFLNNQIVDIGGIHTATVLSNRKGRLYQGLNWLLHDKWFETERDSKYNNTDEPKNNFRMTYENGLRKILTVM